MDLCTQITLMTWMPRPEQAYVLYILAGMWGFTDGIWQTQINGKDIHKKALRLRERSYADESFTIFLLPCIVPQIF